ncbi:MAG TPA: hypothetical protein VG320_21860 [Paraburkholderia sp.]|jgi:hypothetical protein|uniref:hypothetical protein n=1 Tax=Paraburkholderia sp. TaxID=1926495 RepID=UPI002DEA8C11|nr:hypothetical protein [Paraburkholderia sp.]
MTDNLLASWNYFHDWSLDSVATGPNVEPRTLTLGLYLCGRRVSVTFEGATCVCVERLGLLNIVYGIHIVQPDDTKYARVSAMLERGERLTQRRATLLVFVYSTLSAELAIECDSLAVREVGST